MPLHFYVWQTGFVKRSRADRISHLLIKTLWLVTAFQGAAPLLCASLPLYTHYSSVACPGQTGGELRCCSLDDTESVV